MLERARRVVPGVAVVTVFLVLGRGGFLRPLALGVLEVAALALLCAGLFAVFSRRERLGRRGLKDELELGGVLVATTYVAVALGGPLVMPLTYLVVAALVSHLSRAAGVTVVGMAVVFDALWTLPDAPVTFALHTGFLVAFAGLYHAILSVQVASARRAERAAVANRLREVEERARTFRLVSAGTADSSPDVDDHEKWLVASVKEIEGALGAALEIAELALGTQTCAAFLLSADDRSLKLHDCRSSCEDVRRERFPAGEGILGGVLKRGAPVRLHSDAGLKGVTYYGGAAPAVRALLAVPITERSGMVRGVLLADRATAEPFGEEDERLLSTIASEVLRAIEVERVMGYIRKARDEKGRFFKAIEEMNRATAPEQVFGAVLESARQIAGIDFGAVTLVSEEQGQRQHRIARMTGVTSHGQTLAGRVFADNNGLVANVVRYGAPLPGRELQQMDRQVIFDDDMQVRGLCCLKIFPLVAGDRILGTLVAGSRTRQALDDDSLRMLEVIAFSAAQTVLRAQLFEQMERMATTDGLTGLLNHRTFQVRAEEAVAHARRYARAMALILTDIDHFKSVNDTYGHPVGDQVLKGVAAILRDAARDTDLVARYGGEEFAIIMPETDARGAHVIAERIRSLVEARVFNTELGPLKVTLSLGIASLPDDATEKGPLIELADQCLYFAKRHGRNRAVTVAQMSGRKVALNA